MSDEPAFAGADFTNSNGRGLHIPDILIHLALRAYLSKTKERGVRIF